MAAIDCYLKRAVSFTVRKIHVRIKSKKQANYNMTISAVRAAVFAICSASAKSPGSSCIEVASVFSRPAGPSTPLR